MNPSKKLEIDSYLDADFSRMYEYENPIDALCIKSCIGYMVTVADCPDIWQSKLQTKNVLSTMEAEIIELAHNCRELFPIMDVLKFLGKPVGYW